jgi:hypothetical protein
MTPYHYLLALCHISVSLDGSSGAFYQVVMFLVQATALIWLKGPPWCGKRAAIKSSSSPIFQQDANIYGVNKVAFAILLS